MLAWCLLAGTPCVMMALQMPCEGEANRIFERLIERWAWELYWDGSVTGVSYQPRQRATIEVFWNAEVVGICSPEAAWCTSYERNGASIGQFITSLGQSARAGVRHMTDTFVRKLHGPRVIVEEANKGTARQGGGADRYEAGGAVLAIPSPPKEVVVERNTTGLQTCVLTGKSFPLLGPPQPTRDRVTPSNLTEFERWLRDTLQPGPPGTRSEYVIPYYAPGDPLVYILVNVSGATESIVIAAPLPGGAGWRIGGHFDSTESPRQLQRLRSLVLAARMTSILR